MVADSILTPPSLTATPSLEAVDIRRSFKIGEKSIDVLNGISFSVDHGESVFLCGPSGAGKTTLLYVLGGLDAPDAGKVFVDRTSLYESPSSAQSDYRNKHIGYVFQNYLLLPELTALENVALPALIGGKSAKGKARELMERVGLGHRMNHLPAELSGGEQQRAAIARALINDPMIVFADEPTGNLDSKTGLEIMHLLLSVVADTKKTLMVVTHDTRLSELGSRILHLRDGMLEDS